MSLPLQVSKTFVVNTRIKSAEVNQNYTDVMNIIGAHHHDPNIYTGAIPITNSGIAANAQILDTQLKSQITRSGLINQSSIASITLPGIIAATAIPSLRTPLMRVYTSNDTWSKPSNLIYIIVELVAGGGTNNVGGAGAGGYSRRIITAASLGSTETVTVGTVGNSSSFGSWLSATAGSNGGNVSNANNSPAGGGTGSSGDLNVTGGSSEGSVYIGGAFSVQTGGTPGSSFFGSSGAYGSGGTQGVVIVYEYS